MSKKTRNNQESSSGPSADDTLSRSTKKLSLEDLPDDIKSLIDCCREREISIQIDRGKYGEDDPRWLTNNHKRIDMGKVLADWVNYIFKKREKSDPSLELEKVLDVLQAVQEGNQNVVSNLLSEADVSDQIISMIKEQLSKASESWMTMLKELPLVSEILDKKNEETKQSNAIESLDPCTANAFEERDGNVDPGYLIDVDGYVLKVSLPLDQEVVEFGEFLNTYNRHIFIPSYKRANCAQLDWSNAGIDLKASKTLQILVVRPSEFEEYKEWHGERFPIISLPNNEIGIGYARYWIQNIANAHGLKFIWMMDDNVHFFHGKGRSRKEFGYVFSEIENFVKNLGLTNLAAMSPAGFNHNMDPKDAKDDFTQKPPRQVVFLNLKLIRKHAVRYRPQLKSFEDMLFGGECEEQGLRMVIWNRIQTYKKTFKNTGVGSPYQSGASSSKGD